jgi:heptosyltransferase-2
MQKFLIIQTAFLGDVLLATPVATELKRLFPTAQVDFLVRRGNEGILANHPAIQTVLILDKSKGKIAELKRLIPVVRNEKYDCVINLHRFASSGIITALSGAKEKIGFQKNPLSFTYQRKLKHTIGDHTHEVSRNLSCIAHLGAQSMVRPSVFPSTQNYERIAAYNQGNYFVLAPASVWFTKQLPQAKWVELANRLKEKGTVYLVGAPTDFELCQSIVQEANLPDTSTLAGKLNLLDSCALFAGAQRCFVNDSGPLHMASAVNAPTTAFFCATVPAFGFGPLADDANVLETTEPLTCRPCGLHGGKTCPEGHFKCGQISLETIH